MEEYYYNLATVRGRRPRIATFLGVFLLIAGIFTAQQTYKESLYFLIFGSLFALTGLFILGGSLSQWYLRAFPGKRTEENWLPVELGLWTQQGSMDSEEGSYYWTLIAVVFVIGLVCFFILPFFLYGEIVASAFLFAFVAIALLRAFGKIVQKQNRKAFGRSYLAFETFPFYLGESMNATFQAPKAISHFKRATFALTCQKIEPVTLEENGYRVIRHMPVSQWSDEVEVVPSDARSEAETGYALSFPLPEGDYGTDLTDRRERYWQLIVEAETDKGPYKREFFVPVYEKPS